MLGTVLVVSKKHTNSNEINSTIEINADEELVAILEAQDFARWDYNSMIKSAERKGWNSGMKHR